MQPRQMRETSRPVRPSLVYSIGLYGQISYRGYWLAVSEPLFLVDRVKQRLSGSKAAAILYQYRLPFLAIGRAVDRDMRRDQHVWHAPERVVGSQRLGICDIEPGSSEMAGAQRLDQVGRHHTPTARDIDEVGAALHPREQPGIEHPYRLRRLRRRQDYKVRLAQTLLQSVRGCEIGHTDRRLGHPRINAEHAHAECGA